MSITGSFAAVVPQGALRVWLGRNAGRVEAVAADAVGCVAYGNDVVYDSEGRRYAADYRVIAANLDGQSTVVVSHRPDDLSWVEGYPPEFQSRDLGSAEESAKIQSIARNLDPTRLLARNLDATLGPPVVWPGEDGRYYVLGGNGRTLGFLLASDAGYARYVAEAQCRWGDRWPAHAPPRGSRWFMVRVVRGADRRQAAQIAAASQRSTAAEEGRIGRAVGLARSLQIDARNLPPLDWTGVIAPDTVDEFSKQNTPFIRAITDKIDPAQRAHTLLDADRLSQLVTGVLVSLLPASLRASGLFDSPRIEDAMIGALPAIATSHSLATQISAERDAIRPEFDLLPALPDAIAVFQTMRRLRLSFPKFTLIMDEERRTAKMKGIGRTSDASDLAMALAAVFYNASRRAAPEVAASDILTGYVEEAKRFSPKQVGIGFAAFAAVPDPAVTLAGFVPGFYLPGTAPPPPEPEPEPVARSLFNPRPRRIR